MPGAVGWLLVRAVDTACPGVPLPVPVPDDADALLARRLVALLFADDFNALSDTPQGLQKAVDVTYEWCCKWRMKAKLDVCPDKRCGDAVCA